MDPSRAHGRRLAEVFAKVLPNSTYRKNAQRLAEALARHDTRGRWMKFLVQAVGRTEHNSVKSCAGRVAIKAEVDAPKIAEPYAAVAG